MEETICGYAYIYSACIASAIALAYRIRQVSNKEQSNWLLGPLGVAT